MADQIVGFFVILAILGLAAAVILLGSNQRWFSNDPSFFSRFKSGGGISVGMAITLKGFEVGKVDRLDLDPDSRLVTVTFHIFENYYDNIVLENSVLELAQSPIGIGGGLLFHPGKTQSVPKPPLPAGSHIPSLDFKEGLELVRRGLVERAGSDDTIGALIGQVGPVLEKVNSLLFSLEQLSITIEDGLRGDRSVQLGSVLHSTEDLLVSIDKIVTGKDEGAVGNILDNVSETSENLNVLVADTIDTVTESIGSITGNVNTLVTQVVAQINTLVGQVTAEVNTVTHDVSVLFGDLKKITSHIESITADPTGLVTRLIDPKGSIETLMDDDNALFKNIEAMFASVTGIVADLEEFTTFLTSTTPQISGILEDGRTALNQGQDVMEALLNNPLLSGGVPEKKEQPTTFQSFRDEKF